MLIDFLLRQPHVVACESFAAWRPVWRDAVTTHGSAGPFAAAVIAAMQADRMAWAFFCGYQGALQAAFPGVLTPDGPRVAAFCANETARKLTEIETALVAADDGWQLDGSTSWVLAGVDDLNLYVLARSPGGATRGPGSLCVVRVPGNSVGVTGREPRPQSVVPELPHGAMAFNGVRIEGHQILAADGYAEYAKPFRLREDVFVTGCTLAFLLAQGHRARWPTPWRQRCITTLASLEHCASMPPHETATAIVTAGVLGFASDLIAPVDGLWSQGDAVGAARWQRDKPILALGKEARRQRVTQAWAQFDGATPRG